MLSRPAARLSALAATSGAVTLLSLGVTAPAAGAVTADAVVPASARTLTVQPGDDVAAAIADLRAGDTLLLAPGRYDVGTLKTRADWPRGTAAAPVTVRALDPARRPILTGSLRLYDADHWRLEGLRVEATVPGEPALHLAGGTGWVVRDSELTGARRTGAYSNVTITDDTFLGSGAPEDFRFEENCVFGAATAHDGRKDHNVYVSYQGTPDSGGTIARNTVFDHPSGAGIKLGDGGEPGARGPWNVDVTHNTVAHGAMAVLLHGDVRGNDLSGNLFDAVAESFVTTPGATTYVSAHDVVGAGNVVRHTYAAAPATYFLWGAGVTLGPDAGLRPDPGLTEAGCTGLRPRATAAQAYGRWGSGQYGTVDAAPAGTGPLGTGTAVPLAGDWDGRGRTLPGWFDDGAFTLRAGDGTVSRFRFGRAGDVPVVGDWDRDGRDEVGVFRAGRWHLRSGTGARATETSFGFGRAGDVPLVGRWAGAARDGVAVVRDGRWHLRVTPSGGVAQRSFSFGRADDVPVAGAWLGDGVDRPGVVRGTRWHLAMSVLRPVTVFSYGLGRVGDVPLPADGDGDGVRTAGVVRGGTFFERSDHRPSGAAVTSTTFTG
ncbi:hypothetical protein ACFP6A_13430 [Quadrisphaera sp. GCM10027208]|uniref:hypothetical protein n=1 Tax=Quadrisphaera sp. GCM10027208 TaxID=3273423 RepID=UPI00361296BD